MGKSLSGPNRETVNILKAKRHYQLLFPEPENRKVLLLLCCSADGISPVMTDITTVIVEGKPRAVLADGTTDWTLTTQGA